MRVGDVEVVIRQAPAAAAELVIRVAGAARLDRDEVAVLRDACEAFLEGRPLPR